MARSVETANLHRESINSVHHRRKERKNNGPLKQALVGQCHIMYLGFHVKREEEKTCISAVTPGMLLIVMFSNLRPCW